MPHPPPCPGPHAHRDQHGNPSCTGHRRAPNLAKMRPDQLPPTWQRGDPCHKIRMRGQKVCELHGGKTPIALKAGKKREAEAKAKAAIARIGLPEPVQITATEVILWLVSSKYAEVLWLRTKVKEITDAELVWGMTKDKIGGVDSGGVTYEAAINRWWTQLREAENQLLKFSTEAHRCRIEEAMLSMARARGAILGQWMDSLMDALMASLIQAGVTGPGFEVAWEAGIGSLFPAAFRSLGQTQQRTP